MTTTKLGCDRYRYRSAVLSVILMCLVLPARGDEPAYLSDEDFSSPGDAASLSSDEYYSESPDLNAPAEELGLAEEELSFTNEEVSLMGPSAEKLWVDEHFYEHDMYSVPYRWMVRADALFLERSAVDDDLSLAFGDAANPKGTEVLNTGELDFSTRWGPRISLSRCLHDMTSFEIGYFSIDNWNTVEQRSGGSSIQFPSFTHPALGAPPFGTATFAYGSDLHSVEFNLLRHDAWWTWILGFRYIELGEDFNVAFATGGGTSRYLINTDNHLVGFQLGGEAHIWQVGDWSLDGWVKAAVFANSADQSTFEDAAALGGGTASAGANSDETSFLGELGLNLHVQLSDRLAGRAGYQVMWLDRVALAPEQLDNTNTAIPLATLDATGDIFLHGGFVGLEAIY